MADPQSELERQWQGRQPPSWQFPPLWRSLIDAAERDVHLVPTHLLPSALRGTAAGGLLLNQSIAVAVADLIAAGGLFTADVPVGSTPETELPQPDPKDFSTTAPHRGDGRPSAYGVVAGGEGDEKSLVRKFIDDERGSIVPANWGWKKIGERFVRAARSVFERSDPPKYTRGSSGVIYMYPPGLPDSAKFAKYLATFSSSDEAKAFLLDPRRGAYVKDPKREFGIMEIEYFDGRIYYDALQGTSQGVNSCHILSPDIKHARQIFHTHPKGSLNLPSLSDLMGKTIGRKGEIFLLVDDGKRVQTDSYTVLSEMMALVDIATWAMAKDKADMTARQRGFVAHFTSKNGHEGANHFLWIAMDEIKGFVSSKDRQKVITSDLSYVDKDVQVKRSTVNYVLEKVFDDVGEIKELRLRLVSGVLKEPAEHIIPWGLVKEGELSGSAVEPPSDPPRAMEISPPPQISSIVQPDPKVMDLMTPKLWISI